MLTKTPYVSSCSTFSSVSWLPVAPLWPDQCTAYSKRSIFGTLLHRLWLRLLLGEAFRSPAHPRPYFSHETVPLHVLLALHGLVSALPGDYNGLEVFSSRAEPPLGGQLPSGPVLLLRRRYELRPRFALMVVGEAVSSLGASMTVTGTPFPMTLSSARLTKRFTTVASAGSMRFATWSSRPSQWYSA